MKELSRSALQSLPFVCPLDGLPLHDRVQSLTCANNHVFDMSASGYVNLLPVQFKASRDPGDSKVMVSARRRVLDAGIFDELAVAVCDKISERASEMQSEQFLLVDAGCGEGFYTARIASELRAILPAPQPLVLGIDISKWAIIAASKRYRDVGWAVASNKRLPVRNGAASVITNIFGFKAWEAWAQLQSAGQLVIVVDAGSRHLVELRSIIYPLLRIRDAPVHHGALSSGYAVIAETEVLFERVIGDSRVLDDILEMTPHGHKITPSARAAMPSVGALSLTLHALIRVFRRT